MNDRRVRHQLSIGETDAVWLNIYNGLLVRFNAGQWECSRHVYYGKDQGWFPLLHGEPTGHFVEKLPDESVTDPQFVELIQTLVARNG